ncbi:MAG: methyltransferase [Proteobacteria bacterium]|nr:methyltransferase [Pseudomonadota bacterium]
MASVNTAADETEEKESHDSLFDGELTCFQATKGYRFSADSVLLPHFMVVREKDRILDLGTGCGIIMLILLYRWGKRIRDIVGVEVQHDLVSLAKKNLQANAFEGGGRIVEGDIKNLASHVAPESFDTIVCNPPFYGHGSGRQSINDEARFARHQILATLDDFLFASTLAVRNKGAVYFIYPAGQIGVFISLLGKHRLELKRLQFVYSYPQTINNARLVLIECSKNGGVGARVLAPLYIYSKKNGAYTEEMQKFYKKNIWPEC